MGLLIAALGATLAAIVESSVLTQLLIGGVKPDLVLSMGLAVAMVLGFEQAMVWAVVGGLLLDFLLPERAVGSTTLALLLATGAALLVARLSDAPRLSIIGLTVFILTFLYQALLMLLLAVTTGTSIRSVTVVSYIVIGVMNAAIAVCTAWVARGLSERFGRESRVAW
jgi:rod shape-determining protein MreD